MSSWINTRKQLLINSEKYIDPFRGLLFVEEITMHQTRHLDIALPLALGASLFAAAATAGVQPEPVRPPGGRVPAMYLGPQLLDPAVHMIGRQIPNQAFTGTGGKTEQLFAADRETATVVIVRDPDCPVSRRYGPRIERLAAHYADGFRFVFIYPSVDLSAKQRAADAQMLRHRNSVFVERGSFTLAEKLGVRSTGDVFVIDAQRRLRYRGAVDDQYGLGYTRDLPTAHYLRNAMDALRSGRPIDVPATSAPGCYIDADPDNDRFVPPIPAGHLLSTTGTVATTSPT